MRRWLQMAKEKLLGSRDGVLSQFRPPWSGEIW